MEFSFVFSFHPWTPTEEKGRTLWERRVRWGFRAFWNVFALIYSNVKNLTKYTEEHQMQKPYTISMTFSMFLQLNRQTLSFSERKRRSRRTNKKRHQEQQRWLSHDRSQGWYSRTTWAMQSRRLKSVGKLLLSFFTSPGSKYISSNLFLWCEYIRLLATLSGKIN